MGKKNNNENKKTKLFGQDLNILIAIFSNILSWFVQSFFPSYINKLLPKIPEEDDDAGTSDASSDTASSTQQTKCIAIGRPGGKEQLRMITLKPGYVTCGYNVIPDVSSSFVYIGTKEENNLSLPSGTVVIKVNAFSINYADCCIRWGLYESANTYVGWPIVPGFDIAGEIEYIANDMNIDDSGEFNFKVGDKVFGATFFGGYSTRVLVPINQLCKVPKNITLV